jgi:hypothetical protein
VSFTGVGVLAPEADTDEVRLRSDHGVSAKVLIGQRMPTPACLRDGRLQLHPQTETGVVVPGLTGGLSVSQTFAVTRSSIEKSMAHLAPVHDCCACAHEECVRLRQAECVGT